MPVAGPLARARGIELAVTLDRRHGETFELGGLGALVFEYPAETLGRRGIKPEGVFDDPLEIQVGGAHFERMQNLGEVAAVLRHRQAIEQRALGISDCHAAFPHPNLFCSKEPLGLDLDGLVDRIADWVTVPGLLGLGSEWSLYGKPWITSNVRQTRSISIFAPPTQQTVIYTIYLDVYDYV